MIYAMWRERHECRRHRHAAIDALNQRGVIDPTQARPFRDRMRLAFVGDASIGALIVRLLGRGGPSAVIRRVMAIAVHTVDAHSRRTLSHVRQKTGERLPPGADYDPAAAIDRVVAGFRVIAPLFYAQPDHVGGRFVALPRVPVLRRPCRHAFPTRTAAPQRHTATKRLQADVTFRAADTSTAEIPHRSATRCYVSGARAESDPVTKMRAVGNVDRWWHWQNLSQLTDTERGEATWR